MITPEEIEVEKQYLKNVCNILREEIDGYEKKLKVRKAVCFIPSIGHFFLNVT